MTPPYIERLYQHTGNECCYTSGSLVQQLKRSFRNHSGAYLQKLYGYRKETPTTTGTTEPNSAEEATVFSGHRSSLAAKKCKATAPAIKSRIANAQMFGKMRYDEPEPIEEDYVYVQAQIPAKSSHLPHQSKIGNKLHLVALYR